MGLTPEEVGHLIQQLEENTTDRGAKFTYIIVERNGRRGTFEKAVMFVDGIQEPPTGNGGQASGSGRKKFVPKKSAANVLRGPAA